MCYNIPMISLMDTTSFMAVHGAAARIPVSHMSEIGNLFVKAFSFLAESLHSGLLGIGAGIGVLIVLVLFFPALWFSWRMAKRHGEGKRAGRIRKAVLSVFLVFPPTLCGLLLLLGFGPDGITGRELIHEIGWQGAYPWLGALLAGILAAVPVLRLSFQRGLEQTDPQSLLVARTLGIRKTAAFWRIAMPGARRGVAAGLFFGAARAAGEYGACALMAESCLRKAGAAGISGEWTLSALSGSGILAAWIWDLGCLAAGAVLCALVGAVFCRRKRRTRVK